MTKAITPKPRTSHLAGCAHCKAEARILHARQHLSPDMLEQIRKTERAYEALELEFQQERQAELAAVKRGVRPVPGQWKLDQLRLSGVQGRPVVMPAHRMDVPRAEPPPLALVSPLTIYRDLWHEEAVS